MTPCVGCVCVRHDHTALLGTYFLGQESLTSCLQACTSPVAAAANTCAPMRLAVDVELSQLCSVLSTFSEVLSRLFLPSLCTGPPNRGVSCFSITLLGHHLVGWQRAPVAPATVAASPSCPTVLSLVMHLSSCSLACLLLSGFPGLVRTPSDLIHRLHSAALSQTHIPCCAVSIWVCVFPLPGATTPHVSSWFSQSSCLQGHVGTCLQKTASQRITTGSCYSFYLSKGPPRLAQGCGAGECFG